MVENFGAEDRQGDADEFQAEPSVSGGDFFLRRRVSR